MAMSLGYGPPADRKEMIALIRSAVERGVTFFDTAEIYGPLTKEELLGESLVPFRRRVTIATKFVFGPAFANEAHWSRLGSRPAHIKHAPEGSLKPLNVSAIDLQYHDRLDQLLPYLDRP